MEQNIRFIRRNGRVIPIRVNTSKNFKDNVKANEKIGKELASEAKDAYHAKLSSRQKAIASTALNIGEGAVALGGGFATAKFLSHHAHEAAQSYKSEVSSKQREIGLAGAAGVGSIIAGKIMRASKMSRYGLMASGTALAATSAYGYYKTLEHQRRANKILRLTQGAKNLLNGDINIPTR